MNSQIKIGVLTSSRADYGIYKHLLKIFHADPKIELSLIVFGMHLQKQYGETIKEIINDNYHNKLCKVFGMPFEDSKLDISKGYGELVKSFSEFWNKKTFDLVFALGDRFEMSAAVQAGLPFELKFAHIHGGEISLGSIDNVFRDQISVASQLHFTSTLHSANRLKRLLIKKEKIYNVGSLSLDNLNKNPIPSWETVCEKFSIPRKTPFILITFHPETIRAEKNKLNVNIIYKTLIELSKLSHLIITQSNADNYGKLFRNMNHRLKKENPKNFSVIESFGKMNYFSAIKNSKFLLGNSSSGIIEAASFGKYVINVGNRQSGRIRSKNIIDVNFNKNDIINSAKILLNKSVFKGKNLYKSDDTAIKILKHSLNFLNK